MQPLELALSLADRAGEIMLKHFVLGIPTDIKADGSPLTVADTTINQLVIDELKEHFPEHSVLAEEQSRLHGDGRWTWVCDPIDGTIPYSRGCPTAVFSLALCENGIPQLGVLYDPFLRRMLVAERGKRATLNGERIATLSNRGLENQIVSAGITHPGFLEAINGYKTTNLYLCSVCYSGILLALDQFVGVVFSYRNPWDGAALQIIIEEVGGKMTDLRGDTQRYDKTINGFLAATPPAHAELLAIIRQTGHGDILRNADTPKATS